MPLVNIVIKTAKHNTALSGKIYFLLVGQDRGFIRSEARGLPRADADASRLFL